MTVKNVAVKPLIDSWPLLYSEKDVKIIFFNSKATAIIQEELSGHLKMIDIN